MNQSIFDKAVDNLSTIVEEGARADRKTTSRFIEPAQGTLRRAQSRRHHIVFGRRGSGKSSLLLKAVEDLIAKDHPIAFVDLEPFKGHHYPDIIISVLIASLTKYFQWLESRQYDNNKRLWYTFWLMKQVNEKNNRKQQLLLAINAVISELITQLHLSDNSKLIERIQDSIQEKDEARAKANARIKNLIAGGSIETDIANAVESYSSKEVQEEFKRSKRDYLHRKILEIQDIFRKLNDLTNKDCYLFLDDLYHIHRADQPHLLDYFHRIAKGNRLWIKIGTIKNRSTWYIHSPQPIGLKLGDDADEINLDLTLEKFSSSRDFLKSILQVYIDESGAPQFNDIVGEGGLDRLVLSCGGVARDFLGIFRRSIDETRERLRRSRKHHRGPKISAEDVNAASGGYGDIKKEEFQRDTMEDRVNLEEAFNKIRLFCLDKAKKNIFLVDQELRGKDKELLELIDLRLIHHVQSRVTVSSRPGKVFTALLLDVSQYTGERARRDVEMIDFWKQSKKENLRKASLIFDPRISTTELQRQIDALKKGIKSGDQLGSEKQGKLF